MAMEKTYMEEQEEALKVEFADLIGEEQKAAEPEPEEPSGEEPAVEPEPVQEEPLKLEEPPSIKIPYDYGELPEELRKPFDTLTPDQKNQVLMKRLSDTQRWGQQTKNQLNQVIAQLQKKPAVPVKEELVDAETKAWQDEPGFKKAIAGILKPYEEAQAKLNQIINFFVLKEAVPDVVSVVQSQQYNDWLIGQEPSIQALHNSNEITDNIAILRLFQKSALYDQLKTTTQAKAVKKKETIAAATTISSTNRGVPAPKNLVDSELDDIQAMEDDDIIAHSEMAVGLRAQKRTAARR